MSGGGGGGTSTTVQNIPDELKPLATAYTNKAIALSDQPYQPYTGQRFAGLNDTQNAGLDLIQKRALNGSPTMTGAESALNQTIGGQSNPYLDSMVNRAQRNVVENFNQATAGSGSFGNSGLQETLARQLGDTANQMYGQAYEGDAGRRLQAIGMAPTFGNAAYQDASQLLNAGQIKQDAAQQGLDFGYGQFQEAQNDPYKKLAAMSGVFNSNLGGTSTTSQNSGGK